MHVEDASVEGNAKDLVDVCLDGTDNADALRADCTHRAIAKFLSKLGRWFEIRARIEYATGAAKRGTSSTPYQRACYWNL